jgi:hypothetical protein
VHRFAPCAAIALAISTIVRTVAAQGADDGAAEALFQSGKALLEQKNYAAACPKLTESYHLDPGTGTLLALALCHEGDGLLASAWGEFADVVARSRREGRPDREKLARQHMTVLESRLPTLTISLAPGAEQALGLEIKRDGVRVGAGSLTTAVPVDPGHHHVEATAPGYKPFSATLTLSADGQHGEVLVPVLVREPEQPTAAPHVAPRGFWNPLRLAGLWVGFAGVAGLATGSVFGLRAIDRNNASKNDGCNAMSVCSTPLATSERRDAQWAGEASTVAFAVGGGLLAVGAGMVVFGDSRSEAGVAVKASPIVSNRELGMGLEGSF